MLVLSQYVDAVNAVRLAEERGAGLGYLQKDRVNDLDEFTEAICRVARGELVMEAGMAPGGPPFTRGQWAEKVRL